MSRRIVRLVLPVLWIFFILIAIASLKWRMIIDLPFFMYQAYLTSHFDFVPYMDFYAVNMPLVLWIYRSIGLVFGYSDFALRVVDISCLAILLTVTWLWLKEISRESALYGTVVFGIVYLGYGSYLSLQREYLMLLPMSTAIYMITSTVDWSSRRNAFVTSLLLGLCAGIKPQSMLVVPVFMLYHAASISSHQGRKGYRFFPDLLIYWVFGFSLPLCMIAIYLWLSGTLTHFVDLIQNLWPIYNNLYGNPMTEYGMTQTEYSVQRLLQFGGGTLWLIPMLMGFYAALFRSTLDERNKLTVKFLAGLALIFLVYPVVGGKFLVYHWLPFIYFLLILSSLCFVNLKDDAGEGERLFVIMVFLVALALKVNPYAHYRWPEMNDLDRTRLLVVDEVADFLTENVRRGEKVQPIGEVGTVLHSMLISGIPIATPFLTALYAYDENNGHVETMRERFITALRKSKARFIIVEENLPWVNRSFMKEINGMTGNFPALMQLLETEYRLTVRRNGYIIYERMGGSSFAG